MAELGILLRNPHRASADLSPKMGMTKFDPTEAQLTISWRWETQSRNYANYGNANQWTVNAGLASLARESAQNSNDARLEWTPR